MNENSIQIERAVDCIAKHGAKYPHGAVEHLELISTKLVGDYMGNFKAWSALDEPTAMIRNSIASIAARKRCELRSLVENREARGNPYADAKYALHLLDRLHLSPWDDENAIVRLEVDFVYDKLMKYSKALEKKDNDRQLPVIHELRTAINRTKSLRNALDRTLTAESAEDVANIMNVESYMLGKLVGNVPAIMLESFWSVLEPRSIYGTNVTKLNTIYEATREVLSEMDAEFGTVEEWYTAGITMLDAIVHNALKLAQYSDYVGPLRPCFEYAKRGLELAKLDLMSMLENGNDELWVAQLLKRNNELLDKLKRESSTIEPIAHITLSLVGAMEFCGVFESAYESA